MVGTLSDKVGWVERSETHHFNLNSDYEENRRDKK